MSISSFLIKEAVITELNTTGVLDTLEEGAKRLRDVYHLDISAESIKDYLFQRERLGSTGLTEGVAFPHARVPGVEKVYGLLALSRRGVNFNTEEGKPVHIFLFLIGPEDRPGELLRALAAASRLLRRKKILSMLMDLKDRDKIYNYLIEEDERLEKA